MTALGAHASTDLLSAYLDGELPASDGERVETHLGRCPSCRAELDSLRRVVDTLRRLERTAPPPTLAQHVARRVALEGRRPGLLARFEDEVARLRPRISILMPFTLVFALATMLYFFAQTLVEIENRGPAIVIPPPEAARAFREPGTGEAAGVPVEEAPVEEVRSAGARSFRRAGDAWFQIDLPPDAAPREIAAGSEEAAALRREHPWLDELLAEAPAVVLMSGGEPVRVHGAVEARKGETGT
jgi:anti-sigma factor RsiW